MRKLLLISFVYALICILCPSCINRNPGQKKTSETKSEATQTTTEQRSENADSSKDKRLSSNLMPIQCNPQIQVYLETSGSMNGYVNGGTSTFQQVIKEFLSGIINANFASEVTYNYITNKVTKKSNDLNKYITTLTPSSFETNGNIATTDIGLIFSKILSMTDPNTISILISDCIISPGRNINTKAYLNGQMTDIRNAIVGYINQYGDLACLVYQFDSEFNGNYFDYENNKRSINQHRPFYIWIFGHTLNVAMLKLKYVPDTDFRVAPIRNQWMIFNTDISLIQNDYQYGVLLPNNMIAGKYNRIDKTTIRAIQKSSVNDNYRFSFGANISIADYLMGEDYVNDTKNYTHLINKASRQDFFGQIETDTNTNDPYSNIFHVESATPFPKGIFTIGFTPRIPDWAIECTDYDDRSFDGTNDDKTYGLEAIFNGIYNGYNSGNNDNIIAEFDFVIK